MRGKLLDFLGYLRFVLRRWTEDRCPQIAGSLTFTTLLALVPTFAIAVSLLSALPFFEDVLVQIKIFLLLNLVPDIAGKIITVYMEQFRQNSARLTTLGVVVLFVTALALMLTVDRSINAIWRVRRTRPWWISLIAYVMLLVMGPLLIGASVSVTTYLMMTLSHEITGVDSRTHSFLLQIVPITMSALAFFLLYRLVPHQKVAWPDALVGGVIAAVMFELAKQLFAVYVRWAPLSVVYGAFAAVPFFLLWMYLSWLVVLLGAELAASLDDWRTGRWRTLGKAPHLGDAVGVVQRLFEAKGRPVSFLLLRESARIPPAELERVLDHLVASGLVQRMERDGYAIAPPPQPAEAKAAPGPAPVRKAKRGRARSARSSR